MERFLRKLIREILMTEASPLLYGLHKSKQRGQQKRKSSYPKHPGGSFGSGWWKTPEGEHHYSNPKKKERLRMYFTRNGWYVEGTLKGKRINNGPFDNPQEARKSFKLGWLA